LLKAWLRYDNGTILITGITHVPFATVDPRTKDLRAQALYYQNIVEYLRQSEIVCNDYVLDLIPSPTILIDNNNKNIHLTLRDYQQEIGTSAKRKRGLNKIDK
jgi:Xeroderma pigmentosum group B helicase damage recognition domain